MSKETLQTNIVTSSRQHFLILDGLRGIAALAVVIFHFMEWVSPDIKKNFIGHGFLAVDFFFCLSGFVIAYAYDNRIAKLGLKEFLKSRLIRLHPLVILGSVLGLLFFYLDPFATSAGIDAGRMGLFFICSLLLIPFPFMEERFFNLFALNAPSWSLFWEYVANIFYGLILYKLRRQYLLMIAIVTAIILCIVSYRAGNLLGGWSKDNILDGGARVAYSFTAGLLIFRFNWIIKNNIGFIGLSALLLLAFLMPWFTWNWIAEALLVIFYFPLIVSLGAGSSLSNQVNAVCRFSGKISYPLYMTHYAFIWMFGSWFTKTNPSSTVLIFTIIGGTLFLIVIAWLFMKYYDEPVREYFTKKRMKG